ncbi:hypothetical protein F2Q68_00021874 [Brassica cretica]|uniref:Uncharacterized protein n=1 Tax=Brassica cretica TaxID=69181 RepID=A0A8S9FUF4_BRACR|nr:hypothetical protein F2Q68_00021874 [Brassica cretica]
MWVRPIMSLEHMEPSSSFHLLYLTRDSEVVLLVELFDEAKARSKDILIERVNIDFCLPASFTFWGHLNRSLNLEFNSVQVRKWTPEELLDQTAEAFGYTDGAVKLKKKWCDIVRFFEGYLFGQDTSRLLQCEATTKSYEEMIPPSRSHTPVYKL